MIFEMESLVKLRLWTILQAAVCVLVLQLVIVVSLPVNSSDGQTQVVTSNDSSVNETSQSYYDILDEILENTTAFTELGTISSSSGMDTMELILLENEGVSDDMKQLLVEGDIVISTNRQGNAESSHDINRRNALRDRDHRWPDGVVPYAIDQSFGGGSSKTEILNTFRYFETLTLSCIQFVLRTSETDYLHIVNKGGCWSGVGRKGGAQELSLGGNCVTKGVILHELMHALGFLHEHSRTDRDDYVTIHWENIQSNKTINFQKYNQTYLDDLNTTYDFQSIMHYNKYAFSRNNQSTIEPKQSDVNIGDRTELSKTDLIELKQYYQCSCRDRDQQCQGWANAGRCESNKPYMDKHCRKSCNMCKCVDKREYCSIWKEHDFCTNNPRRAKRYCRRTCGFC